MALAGKRAHRFGFTTREEEGSHRGNIVLEHCRGKLIVGTRKGDEKETRVGEVGLKDTMINVSNTNECVDNSSGLSLGQSGSAKLKSILRSQLDDLVSFAQIPDSRQPYAYLNMESINQYGIREKSVSIPKSHFRDGLQNIVIKRPLSRKNPDETASDFSLSKSLASEYIRTTYKECNGDRDAMQVSIRTTSPADDLEQQKKNIPQKKKPFCRRWSQRQITETNQLHNTENTSITVLGKAGGSNICKVETAGDPVCLHSPSVRKQLPKLLPTIDNKKPKESNSFHHHSNILLRKSWRLPNSKTPGNSVNATNVFVSGVNIHPVSTESLKTTKTQNISETDQSKSDAEKPVELLQLSVPVFHKKPWRGSPVLHWEDQQQMVALGRPKSVNERSGKLSNRINISFDSQKLMPDVLPTATSKETMTVLDNENSVEQHQECNDRSVNSPEKKEEVVNNKTIDSGKLTSKAVIDRQSPVRQRYSSNSSSSDASNYESLSDHAYKISPNDISEPCLRISNMSPKMQGPTSNILEQHPTNRSDTSVQKREKGARFRVCKPMFDVEDYEDFQHKKFKKYTGKTKYSSKPRNPADSVHYLRVQIGEF